MRQSYWLRFAKTALTRRRVLVAAAGFGTASAVLAACGSSNSGGGSGPASASLVAQPSDTTKQANETALLKTERLAIRRRLTFLRPTIPLTQSIPTATARWSNLSLDTSSPPRTR
jgi:hypothetical protein